MAKELGRISSNTLFQCSKWNLLWMKEGQASCQKELGQKSLSILFQCFLNKFNSSPVIYHSNANRPLVYYILKCTNLLLNSLEMRNIWIDIFIIYLIIN